MRQIFIIGHSFWPTKSHRVSQRKKQRKKSKLVRSISSETKGNLSRETYNPKMHPQFLAQIQHSICFNGNFQNDHWNFFNKKEEHVCCLYAEFDTWCFVIVGCNKKLIKHFGNFQQKREISKSSFDVCTDDSVWLRWR